MLSRGIFQSSCQRLVRRLLYGSGNFVSPWVYRDIPHYRCFSKGLLLKPLFLDFDAITSVKNFASRRRENPSKINSFTQFPRPIVVEQLSSRRLMKVRGPDSKEFLQLIVTADVAQLAETSKPCIYTMLLNKGGRVLHDLLLYKISEDEYWLEYDAVARIPLQKHLEMFTRRKDVSIEHMDDVCVWVAYQTSGTAETKAETLLDTCKFASHLRTKLHGNIVVEDPRVAEMGCRIIVQRRVDLHVALSDIPIKMPSSDDCYSIQRYKLGVGEGTKDHPPEECLPLECNLDYLGGIHFDKDYYLGKELTTHIRKTGFTWRRLMPVVLSNSSLTFAVQQHYFPVDCPLINQKGVMIGRLRNNFGVYGLAALIVGAALDADALKLKGFNIHARVTRPSWWPDDYLQDGRRSSISKIREY